MPKVRNPWDVSPLWRFYLVYNEYISSSFSHRHDPAWSGLSEYHTSPANKRDQPFDMWHVMVSIQPLTAGYGWSLFLIPLSAFAEFYGLFEDPFLAGQCPNTRFESNVWAMLRRDFALKLRRVIRIYPWLHNHKTPPLYMRNGVLIISSYHPLNLRVNCQNPESVQDLSNNKTFVKPNERKAPGVSLGGFARGGGMPWSPENHGGFSFILLLFACLSGKPWFMRSKNLRLG